VSQFNYELAALVLVESIFYGDERVAEKYGISTRSIQRYRKRLQTDDKLSELVALKSRQAQRDWINKLPPAIEASIEFLRKAANAADVNDPQVIHSIAGSLKILSEIEMTKAILDARFAGSDRPETAPD